MPKLPELRAARVRRGLSQVQLSTLAGCSRDVVSRAEAGGDIGYGSVESILRALEESPVRAISLEVGLTA
jgi:predicted transcriptional regulator